MRWSEVLDPDAQEQSRRRRVREPRAAGARGIRAPARSGAVHEAAAAPCARSRRSSGSSTRRWRGSAGGASSTPALQPAEPWLRSGRWEVMGETLFRLKDRAGRDLRRAERTRRFLRPPRAPSAFVQGPAQIWYQVQTSFRDEVRPRSGVIRMREFPDEGLVLVRRRRGGLETSYGKHLDAYERIFRRCGLGGVFTVEAFSGTMGGTVSTRSWSRRTRASPPWSGAGAATRRTSRRPRRARASAPTRPGPTRRSRWRRPTRARSSRACPARCWTRRRGTSSSRSCTGLIRELAGALVLVRGDDQLNEQKLSALFDRRPGPAGAWRRASKSNSAWASEPRARPSRAERIDMVADWALQAARNLVCGANKDGFHLVGVAPGVHSKRGSRTCAARGRATAASDAASRWRSAARSSWATRSSSARATATRWAARCSAPTGGPGRW